MLGYSRMHCCLPPPFRLSQFRHSFLLLLLLRFLMDLAQNAGSHGRKAEKENWGKGPSRFPPPTCNTALPFFLNLFLLCHLPDSSRRSNRTSRMKGAIDSFRFPKKERSEWIEKLRRGCPPPHDETVFALYIYASSSSDLFVPGEREAIFLAFLLTTAVCN